MLNPLPAPRRCLGAASLATLMVLLLMMGMAALVGARVLHDELMSSEALVQGHQRQSLQESGLDWGLRLLNSPAIATSCEPDSRPGLPFAEAVTDTSERGRRRLREAWQGLPFVCSHDGAAWICHCPDEAGGRPGPGPSGRYTDHQPRFSLEFQGMERADAAAWRRRTLRLLVQACAEGQAPCELPGTPPTAPLPDHAQAQLVVLSSALAQAPGSALISAEAVDLRALAPDQSGLALPPEPDSAWALQAGGEVAGAEPHVQGPPGSDGASLIRSKAPDLALSPERFFRHFFGMASEAYRSRPGLSVLDCRGRDDCSAALEARVRAGHAWLWIQGPLRLRSALSLGSRDSPVLLVCEESVELDAALQLTGLLYSHGSTRLHSATRATRIEGALLSAGPSSLAGRVQIVHSAPVLRRLAELRGSWVRLPGGWAP